jgi:diguanylate cyclase
LSNSSPSFIGSAGRSLGLAVIERLTQFDLPVTPAHYEVMFGYQTGSPADLVRDINLRVDRGERITHALSESLFEKYFASAHLSAQMLETGGSIARELEQVLDVLRSAGANTKEYGETLRAMTSADTSGLDPAGFKQLVAQLVSATTDMALENQKLSAQMEQSTRQVESLKTTLHSVKVEALTDRLTGLANRRLFDETLELRMAEATSSNEPLCLLMCDVDHFKRFNDTWGHVVGDQVIRYIASVLRAHAHDGILAARYGGEEFALIFPRTAAADALAFAESVHRAVSSKHLSRRSTGESIGAVTISIGLAEWRDGEVASDLIERADQCLYVKTKRSKSHHNRRGKRRRCVEGAICRSRRITTSACVRRTRMPLMQARNASTAAPPSTNAVAEANQGGDMVRATLAQAGAPRLCMSRGG